MRCCRYNPSVFLVLRLVLTNGLAVTSCNSRLFRFVIAIDFALGGDLSDFPISSGYREGSVTAFGFARFPSQEGHNKADGNFECGRCDTIDGVLGISTYKSVTCAYIG